MSPDHNLLFGVLALQADLLDAGRFAEACSAWAARKQMPLADLLIERGWLTPQDRADVDRLVQRKLDKHKGDVRAGLAEVTTAGVRQSLSSVADSDVRESLAEMPTLSSPPTGATTAYQPEDRGRYKLTRLHAQGGIGQVWLARDPALGRDVALKELRPDRSDQAVAQARFLEEACITGQLEHPGIVPVHELVRGEDGRPFYTMRLVRGRTLAEAIKDYHEKRQANQAGPLELRGLLGALVAVCNAVSYAHSRGVIHRDLKPSNVVMGDFGEVVVLDWGLARLLGQPDKAEEATQLLPVSVTASSRDETMQGQVLGTPAYMAPEQAEGRLDLLGPATDVHGLEAILYEVLTGQPPFTGGPTLEVLRRVVREVPLRPAQRMPGTPRPLEEVCLKALAKKPAERYATAGELADEVEHWLADEPVKAWREPARVRAGRWVRRHQSLVAGLAAGLLVVLLLGGASGIWLSRERERQRAAAESALERVAALQQQARWEEARYALEQAELGLGELGTAALRNRMAQARNDLELVARLDAIRLDRAKPRNDFFDYSGTARKYAEAFAEAGLGEVGEDEETVAARVAGSTVREPLVAALDDWANVTEEPSQRAWLLGVARQADPDVWRDRLRDPALWQDQAKLARVVAETPQTALTPSLAVALGWRLVLHDEALLRSSQQRWPGDFWLNFSLGMALANKSKPQEAEGYCRAALGLRPENSATCTILSWVLRQQGKLAESEKLLDKAIAFDPQNAYAHNDLGLMLLQQGKLSEAEKLLRNAIELAPKHPYARSNLATALQRQGKLVEAEKMLRTAIELNPSVAETYNNLGFVLQRQGKLPEAEKILRKSVELDPHYTDGYNRLGWVLELEGKLAEAEKILRKSVALDPKFADSHNNLGWVFQRQGNLVEAEKMLRKAIDLDPNFAEAHHRLGWVFQRQGKLPEAETMLRKAIELDPKPARYYCDLGLVLHRQGRTAESEKPLRKAIEIDPKYAMAHNNLGVALNRLGNPREAEKHYRTAIELEPRNALAHANLGSLLIRRNILPEAEKLCRKAIELDPNYASSHFDLGLALLKQAKLAEAEKQFHKTIDLDPNNAEAHCNLGHALFRQGKFDHALLALKRGHELGSRAPGWPYPSRSWIRGCERMIALDAKLTAFVRGDARLDSSIEALKLAGLCQLKSLNATAVRLYSHAFAADAKLADDLKTGHRYNAACHAALAGCGKGNDAGKLDDKEKGRLRNQALVWLRADLALWTRQLHNGRPADRANVQATLRYWQKDEDLAGIRGKDALAVLSEAERQEWNKLWAEIAALLDKTRGT